MWRALTFLIAVGACFGQAVEYNPIFRGEAREIFSRKPNGFLVEVMRGRKEGKALDVGMGEGRNSIYLAQQGWAVGREAACSCKHVRGASIWC